MCIVLRRAASLEGAPHGQGQHITSMKIHTGYRMLHAGRGNILQENCSQYQGNDSQLFRNFEPEVYTVWARGKSGA